MEKATPFLKWVGGKRGIIRELKSRLPENFNNYYEPFVGGGALFFELAPVLTGVFISDVNDALITTYSVIQKRPEELIELLKVYKTRHCENFYYAIRLQHHLSNPVEIAARMIYLNKTCFNGLYRVNKKGEFNVPMGSYVNPNICQEDNILACSDAMINVTVKCINYSKIKPHKGDFVYFDPPYHTDGSAFTTYSSTGFTAKDQEKLAAFCIRLHKKGVKIMLSNSNTEFIRNLYPSPIFNTIIINAPRTVSCRSKDRVKTEEVLITNY